MPEPERDPVHIGPVQAPDTPRRCHDVETISSSIRWGRSSGCRGPCGRGGVRRPAPPGRRPSPMGADRADYAHAPTGGTNTPSTRRVVQAVGTMGLAGLLQRFQVRPLIKTFIYTTL
ncbi:hypothetical protein NKH18_21500 [Streptomyces sp. M10(2022)]